MTISKREAQSALDTLRAHANVGYHVSDPLQSLIDAMPPDPETREERLGRVCCEAFYVLDPIPWENVGAKAKWIAAAAAVAEECKPREITPTVALELYGKGSWSDSAAAINRYIRGEDA